MRLSDDFLSDIRYRNPIEDVVAAYVDLKQSGNVMKGLCPFHNEKTPSFTVYPATASYYCFGCQNGGDVITFIKNIENLDYMESVKLLADRAGMSMPVDDGYDDSAQKLRKRVLNINKETARFYHNCLKDPKIGKRGYDYFCERALKPETMVHFGLGYAPDSGFALVNHLRKLGYNDNEMIIANVAGKSRSGRAYDRFRGKMMFPLIDLRGNVIAFGGRKFPGDEGGKYINTSDTPVYKKSRNLYALNFAKSSKSESLILCEGYMDVIAMHQAGITNAVAALGTSFTDEMAALLARYAKEVIVNMDSDEAGQRGALRTIEKLNKTGLRIRVLLVPSGKDPDEYIREYGAERFKLLLDKAPNYIEFLLSRAKKKYDCNTDDGKIQFLGEAVGILAGINNEIAENLYAVKIAEECGVSKQVILTQIKSKKSALHRKNEKSQFREMIAGRKKDASFDPTEKKHKRASAAEELILCIIMNDQRLCKKAMQSIDADDFVTDFGRRLFSAIKEIYQKNIDFSITCLSGDFSGAEMGKISYIYNRSVSGGEDVLLSCIKTLKEEKAASKKIDTTQMSNEQFTELFNKLGKDKK